MMRTTVAVALFLLSQSYAMELSASAVDELLVSYLKQGVVEFDRGRGQRLWEQNNRVEGGTRNCTTCHGRDLKMSGRHQRTKKVIEPLAPSVNSERLINRKKIEKWFKRNCKWTLGRECTPQEKGDFLSYINQQ